MNPLRRPLADASRERRLWRSAIALSTALLALSLSLLGAVSAAYQGRLDRDAARSPSMVLDDDELATADPPAVTRYRFQNDARLGWDYVDVVFLAPFDTSASPPPGLTRWPRPGEVMASPALLGARGGRALAETYGTVAGTITDAGLADPGERLAYVGVTQEQVGPSMSASGFGKRPQTPREAIDMNTSWFSLVSYMQPITAWWVCIALFLLAPALVFSFVAVRLGAERRERRIAVLRTVGASPVAVRAAITREVLPPALLGAGVAFGLSLLACAGTWRLPFLHQWVVGSDLRPVVGWYLASAVLAGLVPAVGALLAYRARHTSPFGTRPAPARGAPHGGRWPSCWPRWSWRTTAMRTSTSSHGTTSAPSSCSAPVRWRRSSSAA